LSTSANLQTKYQGLTPFLFLPFLTMAPGHKLISFSVSPFLTCFCIEPDQSTSKILQVTVVKVSDGDTVQDETPEGTKLKIRLYGIDVPEIAHGKMPGQPMGKESLIVLKNKIPNKHVRVDLIDVDRHRRIVAMLWMGNRNINLEMVKEGYAEAYREYLKDPFRQTFVEAEKEARTAKKGIWALAANERPSAFRGRVRNGGQ
jgi:micrococcal nuclease